MFLLIGTLTLDSSVSASNKLLKKGMRDKSVVTLKSDLSKLGFKVPGNGTTYFGKDTEDKVKAFQRYYKLSADGIAGSGTLSKIDNVLKSPLQKGKRHNNTKKLKQDLASIGYPVPGNGTTLYGVDTEKVVKKFQKDKGLAQSGIAEEITLAKIASLKKPEKAPLLKNGVRHASVKTLKKDLAKAGFTVPGNGTTLYGTDTEKKVREFQRYYNLSADGIAGESTLAKVKSVVNSPLQNGKRHNDTKQLKKNLGTLGFKVPGNGTTLYGKDTEKKVKEFQKKYGLKPNGIADEVTLAKIASLKQPEKDPLLKNGVRHANVKKLKRDLGKAGFTVPGNGTTLYGKETEQKVREFQRYYKLAADGIAGQATLSKVKAVVNSPLQNGKRHNDTKQLKKDLGKLGFKVPGKGTTLYGAETVKQVKAFQKKYKLIQNGIADEITLAKIAELVGNSPSNPDPNPGKPTEKTEYTNYGLTLNAAVNKQLEQSTITTDKYNNKSGFVSADYLRLTGAATISGNTANVRQSANTSSAKKGTLKRGDKINITGYTNAGATHAGSKLWYKIDYKKGSYYIHSSLVRGTKAKATAIVNVREAAGTNSNAFAQLNANQVVDIVEYGTSWHKVKTTWYRPLSAEIIPYIDPTKNDKFQHLRLDTSAGATVKDLNRMLNGKGILSNKGQAFKDASKKHGVNEAYLVAHALLETGNGESVLAKGQAYKGKTVYNVFGIGAFDGTANEDGAKTAYENGWFTPEAAIDGGAEWIAYGDKKSNKGYIYNEYNQNTLYKMKWNPKMNNGAAWKQYATDIAWATKQVSRIKEIYSQIDNPTYHFDIAKYN